MVCLLGFNGERPDPVTGHYLLGNGYRAFNPVLMRFNSPDSWSPFGEGGLNAYTYCVGDPVNGRDPNGHTPIWLKSILRGLGVMKKRGTANTVKITSITKPPSNLADKEHVFLGFHGTSKKNAADVLSVGVHDNSKHIFITNTFDGAKSYASLHENGSILAVYTNKF
ncbi:RHS repeat-associated core domain-containing protein [Pseudomonas sp. Irchel s3b6]|uniref:RHS repeat-associated core domain-containing protein n=1 Tax=unclassified Pseudomonas TaxID=196821 RepID=UPI003530D629